MGQSVENDPARCLAGIYYSDERNQTLAFTDPINSTKLLFYKLKKRQISYNGDLNDLKQLRIGVVRNYIYGEEFDQSETFHKMFALNPEGNVRLLLAERVDLIVGAQKIMAFLLTHRFSESKHLLDELPVPLMSRPVYMAFSRQHPGYQLLLKDFNSALVKIKVKGATASVSNELEQ